MLTSKISLTTDWSTVEVAVKLQSKKLFIHSKRTSLVMAVWKNSPGSFFWKLRTTKLPYRYTKTYIRRLKITFKLQKLDNKCHHFTYYKKTCHKSKSSNRFNFSQKRIKILETTLFQSGKPHCISNINSTA